MTFEMKLAPATCGFSATPYGCREGAGAYTPFPLCEPKRVAFPKCSEARRQVWSHVARPCASYTETRTRGNNVSNDFFSKRVSRRSNRRIGQIISQTVTESRRAARSRCIAADYCAVDTSIRAATWRVPVRVKIRWAMTSAPRLARWKSAKLRSLKRKDQWPICTSRKSPITRFGKRNRWGS